MDKIWYYTLDGSEKYGPYSDKDLVSMIRQGVVTADHYFWMPELKDWMRIGNSAYAIYLPEPEEVDIDIPAVFDPNAEDSE